MNMLERLETVMNTLGIAHCDEHNAKTRRHALNLAGCLFDEARHIIHSDLTRNIGGYGSKNQLTQAEYECCTDDRKISAIKLYRERTKAGLKESKDTVEANFDFVTYHAAARAEARLGW